MESIEASRLMGMKLYILMRKYKYLYRIVFELLIIWFIFEWNNGLIATSVSDSLLFVYTLIEPFLIKAADTIVFISPYGRTQILENEIVRSWMFWFSIGIALVLALNILLILMSYDNRGRKLFANLVILLIDWYAMFGVAVLIMKELQQEYIHLCWIVASFCYFVIQATVEGILFGVVLDEL